MTADPAPPQADGAGPVRATSPPENPLETPPWTDLSRYDQSHYDRGRPGWYVLLWWLVQAIAFPLTPHPFDAPRRALLRAFGAKVGDRVLIRPTARFTYPWKVEIGDESWIGDGVRFYSLDRIQVGCHCVISQQVYLCTGSHDPRSRSFCLETAPIVVGNGAWLATDCFVGPGVTVGANAVVGARSTVLADLPAGQVAWGTPCRPRHARVMEPEPQAPVRSRSVSAGESRSVEARNVEARNVSTGESAQG